MGFAVCSPDRRLVLIESRRIQALAAFADGYTLQCTRVAKPSELLSHREDSQSSLIHPMTSAT